MDAVKRYVQLLGLAPHPEGGFYREMYRSPTVVQAQHLPKRFEGPRNMATAIYYLLSADDFSVFHSLGSDELWHFYDGDPLTIHVLHPTGRRYDKIVMGRDADKGQRFQAAIPAGTWFACRVEAPGKFALCGCTVAPGFNVEDFIMADADLLVEAFPEHADLIRQFTRD
jgi:predicted cupin superfamily sugar epimerase